MAVESIKYEVEVMKLGDLDYKVVVTQGRRYVDDKRTTTVRGCATIAALLIDNDAKGRL